MGKVFLVEDAVEPRSGLVLIHGQGDHVRRHSATIDALVAAGISVVAPELPGHGKAAGKRGHVPGLVEVDALIAEAAMMLRERVGSVPCGIAGHSMGGLLVADYFARSAERDFDWVWLSSPLIEAAHGKSALLRAAGRILSKIWPSLTIATGVRPGDSVEGGADPEVVARERASGTHNRISVGWGAELLRASRRVAEQGAGLFGARPVLMTQGDRDSICPLVYAEALFERLPSNDKRLVVVPGARHEPWQDPQVIAEVCAWIVERAEG